MKNKLDTNVLLGLNLKNAEIIIKNFNCFSRILYYGKGYPLAQTMDYRINRINLWLNTDNTISKAYYD